MNLVAGPQSLSQRKIRTRGKFSRYAGTTYSVFCRTENCGIASTISSGGRVCSKRLRIVGSRLLIRSGIVVNVAMTRPHGSGGGLDMISRTNGACRRPQHNEDKTPTE